MAKPVANKEFAEALGGRIKEIAARVGGPRALADAVEVSLSQIYRYIEGTNVPGADVILGIAAHGAVSVEWLVTGSSGAKSAGVVSIDDASLERIISGLRQCWPSASSKDREIFEEFVSRVLPGYSEWQKKHLEKLPKQSNG